MECRAHSVIASMDPRNSDSLNIKPRERLIESTGNVFPRVFACQSELPALKYFTRLIFSWYT